MPTCERQLGVTAEDAGARSEHTVAWLVAEGIVLAERVDCRYGGRPVYLPGARWSQVTRERRYLESDGPAVVTGRTAFFGPLGFDSSPISEVGRVLGHRTRVAEGKI
ncbi:hypothetical protein [Streptomyces sp. NBC_00564]|uniref:hypothetical protein n=1 Tax=Streptomyces sp. NBC_00564 TaxID=2903663 RepID=UPI00352D6492|nr:hypothetical protein OG256_43020 [Streptomyces sp. NBC_00564]